MKNLLSTVLIGMLCAAATLSWGARAGPLTSLAEIHALTNAEADQLIPVAFEATVTYYDKGDVDLFAQDGRYAIYVEVGNHKEVTAGDRVLIEGTTRGSFRPEIKCTRIKVIHHGSPPAPVPATFKQLISAELDCQRVKISGHVRGANIMSYSGLKYLYLELLLDGQYVDAQIAGDNFGSTRDYLDADVEVTGAVAGKFDSKLQLAGIMLQVQSMSDLTILRKSQSAPLELPLAKIDTLVAEIDIRDQTPRVQVEGTITYYHPGEALVIQDAGRSIWIQSRYEAPLGIGDRVRVTGFPEIHNGTPILTRGDVITSWHSKPADPVFAQASLLASGIHLNDLVTTEGKVLMSAREAAQDEYVLVANGHLLSAIYRHPLRTLNLTPPPMRQVPVGSTIRVTGICIEDRGDQFRGNVAYEILLRDFNDIAVVKGPPLINTRNLVWAIGALVFAVLAIGTRGWFVERRMHKHAVGLASIEGQRRQILEHVSRGRSMDELLTEIIQATSQKVPDTECWCTLADGAIVGNPPTVTPRLRVTEWPIIDSSGRNLGKLAVAMRANKELHSIEQDLLVNAAGLAALALETYGLHADLRYRSLFDRLTGAHNRFSFELKLDQILDRAALTRSSFGLIYIDIDCFKQVNDTYGHHIGDLYLQEIADRIRHQIRSSDVLARIGGDEFALLLDAGTSWGALAEIHSRLMQCFDSQFELEGIRFKGSASVGIAVFPQDATTKDALIKAADAAMYRSKRSSKIQAHQ